MRIFPVFLVGATSALIAVAAGADSAKAADHTLVRVAYLSPDASSADVYVDGTRTLSSVTYKTVSSYMSVSAGSHTVDIRPAGSSSSTTPWAEVSQAFGANAYYTIAVGGRFGQLQAAAFQDSFAAPGQGTAEARFIHMAPDVPAVDVVVKGGPMIFSNISFLQASTYKSLPSGTYNLELHATGTNTVLFTALGVVVSSGSIRSLTGIGGVGSPVELLQIPDAGAVSVAPQGGANTGGGGLATRSSAPGDAVSLWLIAVAFTLLLLARSRRSAEPHP